MEEASISQAPADGGPSKKRGYAEIMSINPDVFGTESDLDMFISENGVQGVYDLYPEIFESVDDVSELLGKSKSGGSSTPPGGLAFPSTLDGNQLRKMASQYGIHISEDDDLNNIASSLAGRPVQEGLDMYYRNKLNKPKADIKTIREKLISAGISYEELPDEDIDQLVNSGLSSQEAVRQGYKKVQANRAKMRQVKSDLTTPSGFSNAGNPTMTIPSGSGLAPIAERLMLSQPQQEIHGYESTQTAMHLVDQWMSSDPNQASPPPPGPQRSAWQLAKAVYNQDPSKPASQEYKRYQELVTESDKYFKSTQKQVASDVGSLVDAGGWSAFYDYKADRINQRAVDDAADEFAIKNRLQIGGAAWKLYRGELEAQAKAKYLLPRIEQVVKDEIIPKLQEQQEADAELLLKDFKTISKTLVKRDAEVTASRNSYKQELRAENDVVNGNYRAKFDGINSSIEILTKQYNSAVQQLQQSVNNGADPEEAQQAYQSLTDEYNAGYEELVGQFEGAQQQELDELAALSSKYQARQDRQDQIINSKYKDAINNEFEGFLKKNGIDYQKVFESMVSEAVSKITAQRETELSAAERVSIQAFSRSNPALYNSELVAQLIPTLISSLGGYVESIGYATDSPLLMKMGGRMAEDYKMQPAEETWASVLDAQNFGKLAGNILGTQAPTALTGAAVMMVSRSPFATEAMTLAASSAAAVTNYTLETASIAGSIEKQILESTGSYEKALNGYRQAIESQLAIAPSYIIEMLPFISGFYKVFGKAGKTFAGRALAGGITEYTTEVATQEWPQTVFEKAIIEGKDFRSEFGDAVVNLLSGQDAELKRFNSVAVQSVGMLGVGAMSGAMAHNNAVNLEAKLKAAALAEISLSDANPAIKSQLIYKLTQVKGTDFAVSVITQAYSGGAISKVEYEKLMADAKKAEAYSKTASQNGLSEEYSSVYASMAYQHDYLIEQARSEADPVSKSHYETRAKAIQKDINSVLSGQQVYIPIARFADGKSVILTQDDVVSRVANDPEFLNAVVSGAVKISLSGPIDGFSEPFKAAVNTINGAIQQAKRIRDQKAAQSMKSEYSAAVLPGLTIDEVASRTKAGQSIDDMDLVTSMAPQDVIETVNALEKADQENNGITEESAMNASDWLYSRWKQMNQLLSGLQDRAQQATTEKDRKALNKAISQLTTVMSNVGKDVAALSDIANQLAKKRPAGQAPARKYLNAATSPSAQTQTESEAMAKARWSQIDPDRTANTSLEPNSFMAKVLDRISRAAAQIGVNLYVYRNQSEFLAVARDGSDSFALVQKDIDSRGNPSWGIHVNLELLRVAYENPTAFRNAYGAQQGLFSKWLYKKMSGEQLFQGILQHELGHTVLVKAFGEDASGLYSEIIEDLEKILPSQMVASAKAWAAQYQGNIRYEEVITELQSLMATTEIKANPGIAARMIKKINDIIARVATKLGMSPQSIKSIQIKSKYNKYIELSQFLNDFAGFTQGSSYQGVSEALTSSVAEKYGYRIEQQQAESSRRAAVAKRQKKLDDMTPAQRRAVEISEAEAGARYLAFDEPVTSSIIKRVADVAVKNKLIDRKTFKKVYDASRAGRSQEPGTPIDEFVDIAKEIGVQKTALARAVTPGIVGSKVSDFRRLLSEAMGSQEAGDALLADAGYTGIVVSEGGLLKNLQLNKNENRPQQRGNRAGRGETRVIAPLEGAPVIQGATGPDINLVRVAEKYAKENGIDLKRQAEYMPIYVEFSKRLAYAYEKMVHDPRNKAVIDAYKNLIRQTKAQYAALVEDGYEFTFFDSKSDPYKGNPWNAMRDLRANKKMAVYGTYDGYGTEEITQSDIDENPMLADTGLMWEDQDGVLRKVTANDLFRAVHDAFGHGLEGAGFRAMGEENAWQSHVRLFTGSAIAAMTSETRGQNSWLYFGPYGETNQTAKIEDTVFAEQKVGLMPSWTWTERVAPDQPIDQGDERSLQKQADDETTLFAAPFYKTYIHEYADFDKYKQSRPYIEFKKNIGLLADALGINVLSLRDAIGGYDGSSEPSVAITLSGVTAEQATDFAQLLGLIAPEIQNSVSVLRYAAENQGFNAVRVEMEVDNIEIALQSLRDVSFEQDGFSIDGNTIVLLDFGDEAFNNKLPLLINKIDKNGGRIKSRKRYPQRADFPGYDSRREVFERIKRDAPRLFESGTDLDNVWDKATERMGSFEEQKRIEKSEELEKYQLLRKKQLDYSEQGKILTDDELAKISELEKFLADGIEPVFENDKTRYEQAKKEIEAIANEIAEIVPRSFVTKFPIKRPSRAAIKTVRWYDSTPTALGDGSRVNILVGNNKEAQTLYREIVKRFRFDLRRNEMETTELGYPKRLVEIQTSNGKIAEIQVMTIDGYLAKDGIKYFKDDDGDYDYTNVAIAKLKKIRASLGWAIPDGVGHYFYEIDRDPNVPADLRTQARELSNIYYRAMANPLLYRDAEESFRSGLSDFIGKVDNANKSNWDKSNKGIAPESAVNFSKKKQSSGEVTRKAIAASFPSLSSPAVIAYESKGDEIQTPIGSESRKAKVPSYMEYDPQSLSTASDSVYRSLQGKMYDYAKEIYDEMTEQERKDVSAVVSDFMIGLRDNMISISVQDATRLYYDVVSERRPEYVKKDGLWTLEYGRKGKSSVRSRVVTALLGLPASRRVNRRIIENMVRNLGYTVENQAEAEAVAELMLEAVGGIDGISEPELMSFAMELQGGVRTMVMGGIANQAYKLARQASDADTRTKYRLMAESFMDQLADQATRDGRANAALYRLYANSPEMIFSLESRKIKTQSARALTDDDAPKSKSQDVKQAQRRVKAAKTKAASKAAQTPKVKQAVKQAQQAASGAPASPTPPTAPNPPAPPPSVPTTVRQRVAQKEKSIIDFIKGKFGIRKARAIPATLDPDVVNAIVDLALEYIDAYDIYDQGEIFRRIHKRFMKSGLDIMSIDPDYFVYAWDAVESNALAKRGEVIAKRLAEKVVNQAKPPKGQKPFDPLSFMIDQLYRKATEDLGKTPNTAMSAQQKIVEILNVFADAKSAWELSKGYAEDMIDNLDPTIYSLAEKAAMKRDLNAYFANDIDPFLIKDTPYGNKYTVLQKMVKDEIEANSIDLNQILLSSVDIQADSKSDFVNKLADRIDRATFGALGARQSMALAEAFADEYDTLLEDESIRALKRSLPKLKSAKKFEEDIRKETPEAERLFRLIKYGAFEPGKLTVTNPDGSLTDAAKLFSEMFNVPYMDDDVRDILETYAEMISKTPVDSVFRSHLYNEMMQFVRMHQIENQFSKLAVITAHFYSFILMSSDTMMKAFNSNALTFPYTTLRTVARNALGGNVYAAGLAAKGFFSKTGYKLSEETATKDMVDMDGVPIKKGELHFKLGEETVSPNNPRYDMLMPLLFFNNASITGFSSGATEFMLAMKGKRETNVIETESVSEVFAKNGKTKLARAWGRFTRMPGRILGGIDMLTAAMAQQGHTADLMYDYLESITKEYNLNNPGKGVKLTQAQKAEIVDEILGSNGNVWMGAVIKAMEELYTMTDTPQGADDKTKAKVIRDNKLMIQSRIMEITYQTINSRAKALAAQHDYLSGLTQAGLEKVIADATWLSRKIGLMETPEGTLGAVAVIQQYLGKFIPMSKFFIATFVNAPMNFTAWALKTNMLTGGILLPVRMMEKRRGLVISKELADRHGIRTDFYGTGAFNKEKQDMLIDYVFFNAAKVGVAMAVGSQVLSAIMTGYDEDPEKDRFSQEELDRLKSEGIDVLQSIPVNRRINYMFGDPEAPEGTPNSKARWKEIPLFVSGRFYGYKGKNYGMSMAFQRRTGLEPGTIYVYGRKLIRYVDNPILFSLFSDTGAMYDDLLFSGRDDVKAEARGIMWAIKSLSASSLSSLSMVKEQSMLKPLNDIIQLTNSEGMYSSADANKMEKALLYIEKQAAGLISSGLLPAEVKNTYRDISYLNDWAQEDPREFNEFMVFKMPIVSDIVIDNNETGPFGYPVTWSLKRELPLGVNYLVDAFSELKFNPTEARYIAMFENKGSTKHLSADFSNYYLVDADGNVTRKQFTLKEMEKARDSYKRIIRDVVEKENPDRLEAMPIEVFNAMIEKGLQYYQGAASYKRVILEDLFGKEGSSMMFIDETDAVLSSAVSEPAINEFITKQIKSLRSKK